MPSPWNSLYCPSEASDAIIPLLRASLAASGYELYDPFGAFPGKSYPQTVKLFVAPPTAGWTRIIGAPDEYHLAELSRIAPCLYLQLDGATAHISMYVSGVQVEPETGLVPHLRDGTSADELKSILSGAYDKPMSPSPASGALPLDVMPEDVRALAGGVDKGAAEKMFNRLSGQLLNKVGGQSDAARALVSGEGAPDWEGSGGQAIRALMKVLTVPQNWREPDFDTLRDAYALHERRRRLPTARLYPGDEAVMARVPNALAYTPVYGGRG